MAQIAYVDWEGLVHYDGKIKDYVNNKLEPTLKDGGRVEYYEELSSPSINIVNYVFTVENAFTETPELFGDQPHYYTRNAGTAVIVKECSPGIYRYEIFNATTNPNDVETFDDIYGQIKELKDAIDAFNLESSDYYNKSEINERFARTKNQIR